MLIWDGNGLAHEHLYLDQCHNPHASSHFVELYRQILPFPQGEAGCERDPDGSRRHIWRSVASMMQTHWMRAFGELGLPVLSIRLCQPEQISVFSRNRDFEACYHAQVWAFKRIRAAALERYLRAVRTLLPHVFAGHMDIMEVTDIADVIVARLVAWHAALPHADALT
jgi:hypothetical protein